MVQAAIDLNTGEFLGIIIPKVDLTGGTIAVYRDAEAWERLTKGEKVDPSEVGIVLTPRAVQTVTVENLVLAESQPKGGNEPQQRTDLVPGD